jgi:hypothetical protein
MSLSMAALAASFARLRSQTPHNPLFLAAVSGRILLPQLTHATRVVSMRFFSDNVSH